MNTDKRQAGIVEDGRAAFSRGAWSDACRSLRAADAQTPLDPDDLDRLATASFLVGDDAGSVEARTRAHAGFLERGQAIRAANSAFWLAFSMVDRPDQRAQATGWLARAQRLIDDAKTPCVEQGWLLCTTAYQRIQEGDVAGAHRTFTQAADIGARHGSADLIALARHGQARCLLRLKKTKEGLALLDEVMVAVTSGEISPIVTGVVYCSVISACHDLFDIRRAQEWTTALQRWCASHPDLVPFRGYCLVRRSELMQLHGAWHDAFGEARRACERLAAPPRRPEAGGAYYQLGELHRLRGDLAKADEAYRLASQAGRKPDPGLALLRLAQGQAEAAETSIRLALQETRDARTRVRLLWAGVEIMLARGDVSGARTACDELTVLAGQMDSAFLRAVSSHAQGAVALAEGRIIPALEALRKACAEWQDLDAPYEVARVRVLTGLSYRQLGDRDSAHMEFDAAREVFERLGAAPDVTRLASLMAEAQPASATSLTGRELEVLRLIATGATNRAIATRLDISEKTVARHVSNIFTKLDLSSRAAATAYAYEHKLV